MQYRYSYAMNRFVDVDGQGKKSKLSRVRNTSERILLIDEDEKQLDDGLFNPQPSQWTPSTTGSCEMLAARHSLKKLKSKNDNNNEINENGTGNVGFLDGHCETMTRKDALRQKYTGNPTADPVDF